MLKQTLRDTDVLSICQQGLGTRCMYSPACVFSGGDSHEPPVFPGMERTVGALLWQLQTQGPPDRVHSMGSASEQC